MQPDKKSTKGFSLIEISIVAVIVGILIFSIVRFASFISQSKIRKKVNDIAAVQEAYTEYRYMHNIAPKSLKELVEAGILDKSVLDNGWQLKNCLIGENSFRIVENSLNSNICIVGEMDLQLVCYIEASLDDKNLESGDGRRLEASGGRIVNFEECASVSDDTYFYAFLVK